MKTERAYQALKDVLPASVDVRGARGRVLVNGQPLDVRWVGEGWLADVRPLLEGDAEPPQIVAARRISPGAQKTLAKASIGWVDETGAAEIAIGSIIVSKSRRNPDRKPATKAWTPGVLAVAEALLCGTSATVAGTKNATGLSSGSCTNALRFLTDQQLLVAEASRGRYSARRIADYEQLLRAYSTKVAEADPALVIQVGVVWRDLAAGLSQAGEHWNDRKRAWACTGALAASIYAPYATLVGTADVYVAADTPAGLEAAANELGLEPLEGGRLHLRPFPTVTTQRLRTPASRLCLAPWPRVYADARSSGVRGEEAAEHLLEVMHGR